MDSFIKLLFRVFCMEAGFRVIKGKGSSFTSILREGLDKLIASGELTAQELHPTLVLIDDPVRENVCYLAKMFLHRGVEGLEERVDRGGPGELLFLYHSNLSFDNIGVPRTRYLFTFMREKFGPYDEEGHRYWWFCDQGTLTKLGDDFSPDKHLHSKSLDGYPDHLTIGVDEGVIRVVFGMYNAEKWVESDGVISNVERVPGFVVRPNPGRFKDWLDDPLFTKLVEYIDAERGVGE